MYIFLPQAPDCDLSQLTQIKASVAGPPSIMEVDDSQDSGDLRPLPDSDDYEEAEVSTQDTNEPGQAPDGDGDGYPEDEAVLDLSNLVIEDPVVSDIAFQYEFSLHMS